MARKDIWVTKRQKQLRMIFAAGVLIVLAVWLVPMFSMDEVQVEEETVETDEDEGEDLLQEQPEEYDDKEVLKDKKEKRISSQCQMDIQRARDEILDVYNIVKKDESAIEQLEVQISNLKEDLEEAYEMLEDRKADQDRLNEECNQ